MGGDVGGLDVVVLHTRVLGHGTSVTVLRRVIWLEPVAGVVVD